MIKNITIRSAERKDAQSILNIYAPFILNTVTSFEMEVPDVERFWERIEQVQQQTPWLVCEIDGCIAGYAYASPHRSRQAYQWSREVSAYIHKDFRQMGIGRALYTAVLGLIRLQGYQNAYAGIVLPNKASIAFHESVGFEKIGVYRGVGFKHGAWHDVGWWQLALRDYNQPPQGIINLTKVLHSAKAKEMIDTSIKHIEK